MPRHATGRVGLAALALVALLALVAGLSGCSSAAGGHASSSTGVAPVSIVASTDVYGDIARQIAGPAARITSIISDPDADPHSYEANPQNQLELSKADVVIENGGGYDDFVDTMLKAAHNSSATVLDVVRLSGRTAPPGGELNEHVWYDFPTVLTLTDHLVRALVAADPSAASTFRANAATFTQQVRRLEAIETTIKSAHAGTGVAITEPVPLYLLQACGLDNRTPAQFSEAVEEGTDVSALVLERTLELFTHRQVALLAYNEQTSGPETERVLAAARANHVAVVPVTETLPAGQNYLSWMGENLSAIQSALK